MPGGVLADWKERRLDALRRERCEHCRRVTRPRAVVECQYDLALFEEVMSFELLKAEPRPTTRVYFDEAGHSERVRIGRTSGRCSNG